jgi:hypothetical protein
MIKVVSQVTEEAWLLNKRIKTTKTQFGKI